MPMKIAVIGTHFVGKTTLCHKLAKYFEKKGLDVRVLNEVVRDCPYPVNEMATLRAQEWIQKEQVKREQSINGNPDVVITDRALLDNFAYWLRVAERQNSKNSIEKRKKDVFEYSKGYDLMIFLQPFDAKNIEVDGFRATDEKFRSEMQEKVNNLVLELQTFCDVPVVRLNGNKEEVFKKAVMYCERYLGE
jgi:nicotinamide riboside kinase